MINGETVMGSNDSLTYGRDQVIQIGSECHSQGDKLPLSQNGLMKTNFTGII